MSTELKSRTAAPKPAGPARTGPSPRWRSSIGLKIIMAVSGVLMVLFIVAHMAGNLHVFEGREGMNDYAHGLRTFGAPLLPHESLLWVMRLGLIAAIVAHIWSGIVLSRRAHVARPVKYAHRHKSRGESRGAYGVMRWGGITIFAFVIWHLLDLTFRTVNPVKEIGDPYGAVVATFAPERWPVTVFYLLALAALGLHLKHGIWSAVQTIAGPGQAWRRRWQAIALTVAVVIVAGFAIVPLAVSFGLVS